MRNIFPSQSQLNKTQNYFHRYVNDDKIHLSINLFVSLHHFKFQITFSLSTSLDLSTESFSIINSQFLMTIDLTLDSNADFYKKLLLGNRKCQANLCFNMTVERFIFSINELPPEAFPCFSPFAEVFKETKMIRSCAFEWKEMVFLLILSSLSFVGIICSKGHDYVTS